VDGGSCVHFNMCSVIRMCGQVHNKVVGAYSTSSFRLRYAQVCVDTGPYRQVDDVFNYLSLHFQ